MFKWLRKIRRTDKSATFLELSPCPSDSEWSPTTAQQPRRFLIRQSLAQIQEIYGPISESLIVSNLKTQIPLGRCKDE
jgi:hypothetical protein